MNEINWLISDEALKHEGPKEVIISEDSLPDLKEDNVRVVHLTSVNGVAHIFEIGGLDYHKYGMLMSTARWWGRDSMDAIEYGSTDSRFNGAKAVVFDVPIEEINKKHRYNPSGLLPLKYLIGVLPPKNKGENV